MKTAAIKVVRSFLHGGYAVAVGSELELPETVARELIAMGKAVRVTAEPVEVPPRSIEPPLQVDGDLTEQPRRRGRPPKAKEST